MTTPTDAELARVMRHVLDSHALIDIVNLDLSEVVFIDGRFVVGEDLDPEDVEVIERYWDTTVAA